LTGNCRGGNCGSSFGNQGIGQHNQHDHHGHGSGLGSQDHHSGSSNFNRDRDDKIHYSGDYGRSYGNQATGFGSNTHGGSTGYGKSTGY
jgi:hypothetical protein